MHPCVSTAEHVAGSRPVASTTRATKTSEPFGSAATLPTFPSFDHVCTTVRGGAVSTSSTASSCTAIAESDRAALTELRTALDAGELGAEGFMTSLRLGGKMVEELKRIVFAPPPAED